MSRLGATVLVHSFREKKIDPSLILQKEQGEVAYIGILGT